MKLKVLAAAAAILISGAASAATFDLGQIDNTAVPIGATHLAIDDPFTDSFLFEVSSAGLGIGVVFDPDGGFFFDIDFTSLTFIDLSTNTVLAQDIDGSDGWALGTVLSHAGEYSFEVAGTVGAIAGSYHGVLATFVPNPIPEPGTYALMLAGLGVLGFVAKRRKPQ